MEEYYVSKYKAIFNAPPEKVPAGDVDVSGNGRWRIWEFAGTKIDAPILGNGDMLAAFAGDATCPQFWITTNDFWQMENAANWEFFHDNAVAKHDPPVSLGSPRPVGRMVFDIPEMKGAEYLTTQDFQTAVTESVFTKEGKKLTLRSWVAATENILIIEFISDAVLNVRYEFRFPDEIGMGCDRGVDWEGSGEGTEHLGGTYFGLVGGKPLQYLNRKDERRGLISGYREFSDKVDAPVRVGFAGMFRGSESTEITLHPGAPRYFVLPVRSRYKVTRPYEYARSRALWITEKDIETLRNQHKLWWRDYWSVSSVRLEDEVIAQRYYLSQYMMGSLSRDRAFPPNILGIATFDRPAWNGNYKINYNHQSPYLGLLVSGHFEQADTHDTPYLDLMDISREMSLRLLGHEGVWPPLGMGPSGLVSEPLLLNMKSQAVHGATNMMLRYELTLDREYAKRVYPFLRAVADFWEADLVPDSDGVLHVVGDGIHERTVEQRMKDGFPEDPINTLGYLRHFFAFMPELAHRLGIDEDKCSVWKAIHDRLAPFPTGRLGHVVDNTLYGGRLVSSDSGITEEEKELPVFLNEGKGSTWSNYFPANIMQIYPAGEIGLGSDPDELQTALNTVALHASQEARSAQGMEADGMKLARMKNGDPHFYRNGAWNAGNLSCLFFPAAVRVGYDPERIWHELRERIIHRGLANGFYECNPHGIENLSTVPNTVQEMMLLSHEGIIRLFRVWPRATQPNAAFTGLWAKGGFRVSSELKAAEVVSAVIESTKGEPCVLENPWGDCTVKVTPKVGEAMYLTGTEIHFETLSGLSYRVERS